MYSGAPKDLNKFFKDASDDPTFPDIQIGSYYFLPLIYMPVLDMVGLLLSVFSQQT